MCAAAHSLSLQARPSASTSVASMIELDDGNVLFQNQISRARLFVLTAKEI